MGPTVEVSLSDFDLDDVIEYVEDEGYIVEKASDRKHDEIVSERVYVGADSLSEAKEFLHEQYKDYDAELVGIEETKMLEFVDVFPAVE